ncbi:MAG: hypothetical protein ACI8QZ_004156 [Chlamydiales bacterium]|jgi:hypothetical protein
MSTFPIHNTETAPEGSRAVLASTEKAMGSIPNLLGTFAGSPALLKAYMALSELQDQETAFDET